MYQKPFFTVILSWLTLVHLGLIASAQQPDYIKPENFVRRRYHSSAKIGDYIYIDGGEWSYRSDGIIKVEPVPKTFSLDLSKSWTNTSVTLREIDRGNAPLFNQRTLWADESTSIIHTFGGENSWLTGDIPSKPNPWYFHADGEGGGLWGEDEVDTNAVFSSLVQPAGGLHASGNGLGWYFGGHLVGKTWPSRSWYSVSGLITYNFSSNEWTNKSSTGYGDLVPHHGVAEFVPSWGPAGLLVMFGGHDSTDAVMSNNVARSFQNITVYEPQSGKWFWQAATGQVPKPRDRACSVGVKGNNNTYEIFVYAGTNLPTYGGDYPSPDDSKQTVTLDEVFVLTLPAFKWFKANYTPSHTRQGHTCHVVGNRQLLTIGGMDPAEQEHIAIAAENATDSFSQGLGIFDITTMAWSNHYNASAAPYESPQVVAEHYRTRQYPDHWDSLELKDLILNGTLPDLPSPTHTMTGAPSHTSPSENSTVTTSPKEIDRQKQKDGIIAGVATGSFAALITIGVLAFLFIRGRQKGRILKQKVCEMELDSMRIEELPDQSRTELPEHTYWELHADPISPPKVRLSAVARTW